MGNKDKFLDTLRKNLLLDPNVQKYAIDWYVDKCFDKDCNFIGHKDSINVKKTCKELGIKNTYKAIKEFVLCSP